MSFECQKCIEFAMDDEQQFCGKPAFVFVTGTPTESNKVGKAGILTYCKECANNVQDSEHWTYELKKISDNTEYQRVLPDYYGIPVECKDAPVFVYRHWVHSPQFIPYFNHLISEALNNNLSIKKFILSLNDANISAETNKDTFISVSMRDE